jgi:anti-sigma factor RsiW
VSAEDQRPSLAELHAYADGLLPPDQRARVEAFLATDAQQAADIAHWQRQNEAISALFAPAGNEPVPERLRPATLLRRSAANSNARWTRIAAALVLVALGGTLGWVGRDVVTPTEAASTALIQSAVTAHSLYVKENRHAVEVVGTDRDHLVTWLSNRVTQPVTPPDLSAEGFTLVGGRLLPPVASAGTGPAALLMYENAAADRLTVFVTSALPGGTTASQFTTVATLDAFYWANDRITCTVVGDLPEAQMQVVAKKIYQQLSLRPDGSAAGDW